MSRFRWWVAELGQSYGRQPSRMSYVDRLRLIRRRLRRGEGMRGRSVPVPAAVGRRRRRFATGRILPRRPGWFGRRVGDSKRRKLIRTRRELRGLVKVTEALKGAGAGELVR